MVESFAIVATPISNAAIVRRLLPGTPARMGERLYFLYRCDGGDSDVVLNGLDNQPLIEIRHFATEAEAKAWAVDDARWRDVLRVIKGRLQ